MDDLVRVEVDPSRAGSPARPFLLASRLVTWDDFDAFCRATGSPLADDGGWGRGARPAVSLELASVLAYCNRLSRDEDLCPCYALCVEHHDDPEQGLWRKDRLHWWGDEGGYRLPTASEWTWAARGGVHARGTRYAGGDELDAVAWHGGNAGGRTQPVARKAPNELGLYDLTGNVMEACATTAEPLAVVLQGGAWAASYARFLEPGEVYAGYTRGNFVGFRLCRSVP